MKLSYKILICFYCIFISNILLAQENGWIYEYDHTCIRYKLVSGIPVIQVEIQGRQFDFVFDTGASRICISSDLLNRVKYTKGGTTASNDINNTVRKIDIYKLRKIRVGDINLAKSSVLMYDSDNFVFKCLGVDGIMSSGFLNGKVYCIDPVGQNIVVYNDRKITKEIDAWLPVSHNNGSSPYLTLFANAADDYKHGPVSVKVLFDTGNSSGSMKVPAETSATGKIALIDIQKARGYTGIGIHGHGNVRGLERGKVEKLYLAGTAAHGIAGVPYITGKDWNIGFKLMDLGAIVFDLRRDRYSFIPFKETHGLVSVFSPVDFTVKDQKITVAAVWDEELATVLQPGDVIAGIGSYRISLTSPCSMPSMQSLIEHYADDQNSTVLIEKPDGEIYHIPVEYLRW